MAVVSMREGGGEIDKERERERKIKKERESENERERKWKRKGKKRKGESVILWFVTKIDFFVLSITLLNF